MSTKHLAFVLILLLLSAPCRAELFHINPEGSGDLPTIQDAVDAAVDGDTISLADGVYKLQEEIGVYVYGKELVIRSESGDPKLCIIVARGHNWGRGFTFAFAGGRDGILEGVTVMDGLATWGAGIYIHNSSPIIRNCIIRDNIASNSGGGGIWAGADSHPLIEDCHIHHNESYAYGGGGDFLSVGEFRFNKYCSGLYNQQQ